jgi:hypothetical protein
MEYNHCKSRLVVTMTVSWRDQNQCTGEGQLHKRGLPCLALDLYMTKLVFSCLQSMGMAAREEIRTLHTTTQSWFTPAPGGWGGLLTYTKIDIKRCLALPVCQCPGLTRFSNPCCAVVLVCLVRIVS